MDPNKPKQAQLHSLTDQITFNNIDLSYHLRQKKQLRSWIEKAIHKEKRLLDFISYNFCSDQHLLSINKKHLHHDDYTDIITFDLCDGTLISGDIYISLDRIKENAKLNHAHFHVELSRVMIHGVLHLCGYKDKTPADAKVMRKKEDYYLSLLG